MGWDKKKLLKEYRDGIECELYKELSENMKVCKDDYRHHKMVASIIRTIGDIDEMMGDMAYVYADDNHEHKLTPEMAASWASHMENSDGTTGAHWTVEQTTSVAESNGVMFDHINEMDWYVTMNMMYSDYGKTLSDAGAADVSVFVNLAKDFLFDEDAVAPQEKLYWYYKCIVKH